MSPLVDWFADDFGNRVHESSIASWLGDGTHDDGPVD